MDSMQYLKKTYPYLLIGCLSACTTQAPDIRERDYFINDLISQMSLEEKIGQMTLYTSGWDVTGPVLNENYRADILAGRCGNLFNAHTVVYNRELQKMAVEQTRLKIPLLFGYDVIHGYKTIFPIPLAEACTWNLDLIRESARLAAREATAAGLNWTYAPMVDITRDPRWGRISEGAGEDSYLGSLIARARTEGFQGESLSDPYPGCLCQTFCRLWSSGSRKGLRYCRSVRKNPERSVPASIQGRTGCWCCHDHDFL